MFPWKINLFINSNNQYYLVIYISWQLLALFLLKYKNKLEHPFNSYFNSLNQEWKGQKVRFILLDWSNDQLQLCPKSKEILGYIKTYQLKDILFDSVISSQNQVRHPSFSYHCLITWASSTAIAQSLEEYNGFVNMRRHLSFSIKASGVRCVNHRKPSIFYIFYLVFKIFFIFYYWA